jgi:hypothetical protein
MMTFPLKCATRNICVVPVSFAFNNTSSPVAASNLGSGFTVTRNTTGLHDIVFTDMHGSNIVMVPGHQENSATVLDVELVSWTASTRTAQVRTVNKATAGETDVAANANNRCNLIFFFKDGV